MKFFTDKTVNNPYLLIKIKDYIRMKEKKPEKLSKYKEVFIDPGVYELTKNPCYSWEWDINVNDFLDSLPKNHYFSFDYPCDMNINFTDIFLRNSWSNAKLFCYHSQYITTIQYEFNNYFRFVYWFSKYNNLKIRSGIMGLGNMCRFPRLNNYIKHSLDYAFLGCIVGRIHIYGLCLDGIPYANKLAKKFKIELSIDSTKWTRAVTNNLKLKYGISCKSKNRQEYFDTYIQEIKNRGVEVDP